MINFNELLAKDLAAYLCDNQEWFLTREGDIDVGFLKETIEGFFKHDITAALLRSKT